MILRSTGAGKTLLLELIAGFHSPDSGKIKIVGRHPLTLSGGEQQRVSLSRALVTDPKILLLDEPLSALDPRTQESARELLSTIHKNKKLTVLHITHDQTEARMMADRIAIIWMEILCRSGLRKRSLKNRLTAG